MKTIVGNLVTKKELTKLRGGSVGSYQCVIKKDGAFDRNETLPGENCSDAGTNYEYYLAYWYPGHTWSVNCCGC